VTSGIGDVTQQTGGIQINIVSRSGGKKLSFGGRFLYIDSWFQDDNTTDTLVSQGLPGINRFDEFRDFGFNLCVPVIEDKLSFWGFYGVQDLQAFTVYGNPENALVSTAAAKLDFQIIPENRLALFAQGSRKVSKGLNQTYSNPEGMIERPAFHFGAPLFSVQDEQTFGNSFTLSIRWGASNAGTELTPMMDPDRQNIAVFDEGDDRFYNSYYFYRTARATTSGSVSICPTATIKNTRAGPRGTSVSPRISSPPRPTSTATGSRTSRMTRISCTSTSSGEYMATRGSRPGPPISTTRSPSDAST
jgi:hypothetical protein